MQNSAQKQRTRWSFMLGIDRANFNTLTVKIELLPKQKNFDTSARKEVIESDMHRVETHDKIK